MLQAEQQLADIVTVGDSNCGKTALLYRAQHTVFKAHPSTIGVEFTVDVEEHKPKLRMWDTAGQEGYRKIIAAYYKKGQAFVIVFDCTDRKSFESVEFWVEHIKKHAPLSESLTYPIILLMTKSEELNRLSPAEIQQKRHVNFQEALEKANKLKLAVLCETSANTGINVNAVLQSLRFMLFSYEYDPAQLYAYSYDKPDVRHNYLRGTLQEIQGGAVDDFLRGIKRLSNATVQATAQPSVRMEPALDMMTKPSRLQRIFPRMFKSRNGSPSPQNIHHSTGQNICTQCSALVLSTEANWGAMGLMCRNCFSRCSAIN